jgi:transcription initiation factor IIE alpha subunit
MRCRICGEDKDISQMVINHTTPVKVHYKDICKKCAGEKSKTVSNLRRANIYPDDSYICPICQKKSNKYYLDHDWRTQQFRGWLCNACNVALGLFKDNVEYMYNAIRYLEK